MANLKSSIKRARQAIERNKRNSQARAMVRTFIKKVVNSLQNNDKEQAITNFAIMQKAIDKAANKGLIHKNKAARKKSKLNVAIKAL